MLVNARTRNPRPSILKELQIGQNLWSDPDIATIATALVAPTVITSLEFLDLSALPQLGPAACRVLSKSLLENRSIRNVNFNGTLLDGTGTSDGKIGPTVRMILDAFLASDTLEEMSLIRSYADDAAKEILAET